MTILVLIPGCRQKKPKNKSSFTVAGPSINMPDGTVLTLTNISLGYEHEFSYAGETNITSYRNFFDNPNPTLEFWFHQTARPDKKMTDDIYLTVADESGIVHLPHGSGYYRLVQTNLFMGERLALQEFDAFPRRATNLTFYVHCVGTPKREWIIGGSFKLPNPAHGPFPIWQPEPLPATRQDGQLEFSLASLKVKVGATADSPETFSTNTGTFAMLRITSNSLPAPDWQVESLRLTDATGNSLYLWAGDKQVIVDTNGLFFASSLWLAPAEPAWKLHAEFSHKSGFSPEELVTIKNVPAITNAPFASGLKLSTTLKGVNVEVKGIKRENNWGGNAAVEIQVWPIAKHFRIALVKVTNERGEEIEMTKPPRGYGDALRYKSQLQYFGLQLPDDTKSLDFTFAYKESRFADYTAKPDVELPTQAKSLDTNRPANP